jgi:long-chain acyl-CoA synthetase
MKTFFDLLNKIKRDSKEQNFFALLQNGIPSKISYPNFLENLESLSSFFVATGVKKQEKIILMMDSSPSWLICDLAAVKSGAVSVPMFANISFDNMLYQFENCNAEYICLQDETIFEIVKKTGFKFKQIITIKPFAEEILARNEEYNIISFQDAVKNGALKISETENLLKEIENSVNLDDTATIIYTSGTSGRPKGVELTHYNLISQLNAIDVGYEHVLKPETDSVFSFLPLAHIFQRTVTYYFTSKCITSYFSNDIKTIADDLEKLKPSAMTVVPRFLEKVRNGLNEKIKNEQSVIKKFIATICFNYASNHEPEKPHNKFLYKIYDKLMYEKIRNKLGGRLIAMICGGAALPDELYRFFINIGIPLYQGYGLTETSPVVACNTPSENKVYTIGKVIEGVELKLTAEQELLVKGPNVMKGYYKINDEGARAIDENGFLSTGDLASIDSEGYIKIIGRKKEQFKTSNGKFINPIKIESLLNSIPYIETSCVIAEGRPFVSVILFPSDVGATKLLEIELSLPEYIRKINNQLDRHEHIHYFHLNSIPASIENGEITPSMKVVRNAIVKKFANVIEDFYSK